MRGRHAVYPELAHLAVIKDLLLTTHRPLPVGCLAQPMQESYRMTKKITETTMIRKISPPCSSGQLFRALFSFLGLGVEPSFNG